MLRPLIITIQDVANYDEMEVTKRNACVHIAYIDIVSMDKDELLGVQKLPFGKVPNCARRVARNNASINRKCNIDSLGAGGSTRQGMGGKMTVKDNKFKDT